MRRLFRAAMVVYGALATSMLACFDWSTPGDVNAGVADSAPGDGTSEPDGVDPRDGSTDGAFDSANLDVAPPLVCGPPIDIGTGAVPLLHVRMDDLASITTPGTGGNAAMALVEPGDFVPGPCDQAVHFVPGVRVEYPEMINNAPLIDYEKGTIMLWYRPEYDPTDVEEHTLLRTFAVGSRGGIRLSRWPTGTRRVRFQWYRVGPDGGASPSGGVTSTFDLPKDVWSHLTVTWSVGALPRIYVGGVLDPGESAQTVTGTPTIPSDGINFGIGASPVGDGGLWAFGSIDDLRIYAATLP